MAHRGGEHPAALRVVTPGDRVVGAHPARPRVVGGLVGGHQDVDRAPRVLVEVVPLLRAHPPVRQPLGGGVGLVGHLGGALQDRRVRGHVGAGQDDLVPPGELRLDVHVGGVVDRHDAAAAAHVGLEGLALGVVVPHHAVGLKHDHRVVGAQRRVGEDGGVLAVVELEVVVGRQLLEHRDAGGDGVVPEGTARRLGEQQHLELGRGRVRDRRRQGQQQP